VQHALTLVSSVFFVIFCFNFVKVILIFSLTRQLIIFKSVWHCLVLYDLINVLSFSLFIVLKKEEKTELI
jgi:hypothetical protein